MKVLTIALTWVFIFLLCFNSYAGDAEDLRDAAWKGDISTIQTLLAKGVDVNVKDKDGETALMDASAVSRLDVVQTLLAKGADVNAKDNYGTTALMFASTAGNLDVVQALLAKGADVNVKNSYGDTALTYASHGVSLEIVQALIAKDADVNAKNDKGETALKLAGTPEISQLLIKAGAKEGDIKLNNEAAAISSMRAIAVACESFRAAQDPPTYPANFSVLAKSDPPYIDSQLGNGEKEGYRFIYTQISANKYTCSASPKEPGITGDKIYFVDESGVVRLNNVSGNPVE